MANLTVHLECTAGFDARGRKLLASSGVQSAFLLNANPEQIQYALDHVSGIVVVRVYDPFNERAALGDNFEKDIILRRNTGDFVAWLNRQDLSRFKGNKRVRFVLGWNEMYYVDAAYQDKQNKAMIAVAKALVNAGYGVAMFGMAADKTIQSEDCQSGVWDEVIDFAIENGEWVHVDIHEYTVGRLASQHLKSYAVGYPRSIEDPASMRQENWGKIDYSLKEKGNWHLGRISWLLARSRELHGKDFFWARGEMGWDYKADGSLNAYIPEYMGRYGKPQGLPSLRPLFNHLTGHILSDKELCEEGYKDLEWFVSQDPDSCLSNAIFADNQGRDHKGFNIGQAAYEHLYTLLGQQHIKDTPMPDTPPVVTLPPDLIPMRLRATDGATYVRNAPNGTILGKISNVWQDAMVAPDYATASWVQVEVGDLKGVASRVWLDILLREKSYVVDMTGGGTMIIPEHELDTLIEYKERELAGLKIVRSAA